METGGGEAAERAKGRGGGGDIRDLPPPSGPCDRDLPPSGPCGPAFA